MVAAPAGVSPQGQQAHFDSTPKIPIAKEQHEMVQVDLRRHEVKVNNKEAVLTPKEFRLLCFLGKNDGIVYTREQLFEEVWGFDTDTARSHDSRTIDQHIARLRKALGKGRSCILTIESYGYKAKGVAIK